MWCAKLYKYEIGEYKDININLVLPDNLNEKDCITVALNKISAIFVDEFKPTHFRLFVITNPNSEGIPQTRFIKI